MANWAEANNVEIAYTPTNSSWLSRSEAQFTALRYFTLDGADYPATRPRAAWSAATDGELGLKVVGHGGR